MLIFKTFIESTHFIQHIIKNNKRYLSLLLFLILYLRKNNLKLKLWKI